MHITHRLGGAHNRIGIHIGIGSALWLYTRSSRSIRLVVRVGELFSQRLAFQLAAVLARLRAR
jgi:hypothetical protein